MLHQAVTASAKHSINIATWLFIHLEMFNRYLKVFLWWKKKKKKKKQGFLCFFFFGLGCLGGFFVANTECTYYWKKKIPKNPEEMAIFHRTWLYWSHCRLFVWTSLCSLYFRIPSTQGLISVRFFLAVKPDNDENTNAIFFLLTTGKI